MLKDSKNLLSAVALSASIALTACGGGGGGGGGGGNSGGGGGGETPQANGYSNVEGPLDAVQEPLATQVFAPLAEGAAGTPVEGLVGCASQLVVTDVLDILDSFLVIVAAAPESLQDPQALANEALPQLQTAITEFATDLPAVLGSLADGDCASGPAPGENPLAGTPLADLFEAIEPVLGGFENGGDPSMASLSGLLSQLSDAFSDGLAMVFEVDSSGQLAGAPVLGGLLTTIDVALIDLTATIAALEGMDTDGASAGVATTLDHLLNNVLTQVLPIALIEEQAGAGPIISGPIAEAVAAITGLIGGDTGAFDGLTSGDFASLFEGGLEDLLAGFGGGGESPLAGSPLAQLQTLVESALSGSLPELPNDTGLEPILQPLTAVLDALMASSGEPSGTPLDVILGPLAAGLGGSAGAAGCPVAGTGLDVLCTLTQGLLDNPSADPVTLLTGLLESLLGGLAGLGN